MCLYIEGAYKKFLRKYEKVCRCWKNYREVFITWFIVAVEKVIELGRNKRKKTLNFFFILFTSTSFYFCYLFTSGIMLISSVTGKMVAMNVPFLRMYFLKNTRFQSLLVFQIGQRMFICFFFLLIKIWITVYVNLKW